MDRRHRRALLFGLLGVTLLANPLYLYPENVSHGTTYTYETTETDRIPQRTDTHTDIERCDLNDFGSDTCVVASDMASGDPVEVSLADGEVSLADGEVTAGNIDEELFRAYDFVRLESRYYEPTAIVENRTLRLSLNPVSEQSVKQTAAEDLEETPQHVRWAVENGTVTLTGAQVPYEARHFYVEHEGAFYAVEPTASERRPTGWGWKTPSTVVVEAMRLGAWITGIGLIWRAGEWSERGRRVTEQRARGETRDERPR
jgi:hypothetical protein